jgi:type IV secretion system protein VirB2
MKARNEMENKQAIKFAIAMGIVFLAIAPELALAAPWDGMGTKVLSIFNNGLTRTGAILAVIACGIAALAGKLSWDWAIKIVVGIILIFGAAPIVDYLIAGAQG